VIKSVRDADSWLNLQAHYDLEIAKDRLGNKLDQEVTAAAH